MSSRLVIILAVCVVLGLAGLGMVKRKANQLAAQQAAAPSVVQQAPRPLRGASKAAAKGGPDANSEQTGIGYGLTYALVPDKNPELATLSCQGEPAQLDRPANGACNPQQGDTSCRTVLPVLCIRAGTAPAPVSTNPMAPSSGQGMVHAYSAWSGGTLAGAPAIMGAILDSEAAAHAYCERELGAGWHMAAHQDGGKGGVLQGQRSLGLSQNQRHWVLSRNQPANCWNSKP